MKCTLMSQCLKKAQNVSKIDQSSTSYGMRLFWAIFTHCEYCWHLWIYSPHTDCKKNVGLQTAFCYRFLLDNLTICNVASSFKFLELLRTWKECLREFWPDGHIIRGRTVITYNAAYDTFSSRLLGLHISRYLRHL